MAGHTQMEVDSMHVCIERKMVGDIYTPRDYTVIMETSRIHPTPYNVKQMNFADFKKLNDKYSTSIRPGKKNLKTQPYMIYSKSIGIQSWRPSTIQAQVWFGIAIEYSATKNSYSRTFEWTGLFKGPVPISKRKFDDLQSMKHVLPQYCHHYFDSLPHQQA